MRMNSNLVTSLRKYIFYKIKLLNLLPMLFRFQLFNFDLHLKVLQLYFDSP